MNWWVGWIPLLAVGWLLLCICTNPKAEEAWGKAPTAGDFLFFLFVAMLWWAAWK